MENGNETPPREIQVQLGQHSYTVVPQRHAYLQRKVPEVLSGIQDLEVGGDGAALAGVTPQVHALLSVFIPGSPDQGGLMPLHEWQGFASADAMDQDRYNEADDHSPDVAQIVEAFRAIARVNRFDLLGVVKDWLGPSFLRGAVQQLVGTKLAEFLEDSGSASGSLPQRNGGSAQTSGGTEAPTVELSGAGPSPASATT